MAERIAFIASFPPIQSAIKIGQDGMRIQLDVPESEMPNALPLLMMRGKALRVTVELVGEGGDKVDDRKKGNARGL